MLEDITKRMNALSEEVLLKERVSRRVKELADELEVKRTYRSRLYAVLYQEKKDVEKLKSTNLSSLFLTLVGQKDKLLEKEEKEMLEAKIKVDRMDAAITLLEDEYDTEKNKFRNILRKEKEYGQLLEEKKQLLIENSKYSEQISDFEKKLMDYKKMLKELDEALSAGRKATRALYEANATLRSAKNWGIYDIVSSKSWISSMVKHNKLASAQDSMSYANHALERFAREMDDVQKIYSNELAVTALVKTLDIWFDNIFTDIIVQRKINAASDDVSHTILTIDKATKGLKKEKDSLQAKVNELEEALESVISKVI